MTWDKDKIIMAVLSVLLALALVFALFTFWPKKKMVIPAKVAAAVSTLEAKVMSQEVKPGISVNPFALRVPVRSKAEEAANPRGDRSGETEPLEPRLEGMWVDADMRVAFISGQALQVGDAVMGWTVVSISKDSVLIKKDSASKILRMEEK